MQFQIKVQYKPRPGSNVGKYVATGLGRQTSVVNNFTDPDQYLRAAKAHAEKLGATVTDDGPYIDDRRVFQAEVS